VFLTLPEPEHQLDLVVGDPSMRHNTYKGQLRHSQTCATATNKYLPNAYGRNLETLPGDEGSSLFPLESRQNFKDAAYTRRLRQEVCRCGIHLVKYVNSKKVALSSAIF
jgi:hypothetical protein